MPDEIHLNDVGTVLRVTVVENRTAVDISTALTKTIHLRSPADVVKSFTANFTTDGVDGQLEYTVVADDLDELGVWRIQGRVTFAGALWGSEVGTFKVHPNLYPVP